MKMSVFRASAAAIAFSATFAGSAEAQDFGRVIERLGERAGTAVITDIQRGRQHDRSEESRDNALVRSEIARDNAFTRSEAGRDAALRRQLQLRAGEYGMRTQYNQSTQALRSGTFTPQYNDDYSRFAGGAPVQAPPQQSYRGTLYSGSASAAPPYRIVGANEACATGERRVAIIASGHQTPACMIQ